MTNFIINAVTSATTLAKAEDYDCDMKTASHRLSTLVRRTGYSALTHVGDMEMKCVIRTLNPKPDIKPYSTM